MTSLLRSLCQRLPPFQIQLKHARLKMLVAAFSVAVGSWLLKTEVGYIDGFEFFNTSEKAITERMYWPGLNIQVLIKRPE